MGKGYENYMSKKWFHPSNLGNMKRLWMAEQKAEAERRQQQLLKEQHDKEQEMFANRQLLGDEKARLGLSFMYNPPIGMTADDGGKDGQNLQSTKLEWRGAPREQWAKTNDKVKDQPFGIQVRDVRCIKCQQRGHINTDKICPLYGISKADKDSSDEQGPSSGDMPSNYPRMSNMELLEKMKKDGLPMRKGAISRDMVTCKANENAPSHREVVLFKHIRRIVQMRSTKDALRAIDALSKNDKRVLKRKLKLFRTIRKSKKIRHHKRDKK
ncbi:hypothetical protein ACOME3_000016 [Neoechinorhynchus agilis]